MKNLQINLPYSKEEIQHMCKQLELEIEALERRGIYEMKMYGGNPAIALMVANKNNYKVVIVAHYCIFEIYMEWFKIRNEPEITIGDHIKFELEMEKEPEWYVLKVNNLGILDQLDEDDFYSEGNIVA